MSSMSSWNQQLLNVGSKKWTQEKAVDGDGASRKCNISWSGLREKINEYPDYQINLEVSVDERHFFALFYIG